MEKNYKIGDKVRIKSLDWYMSNKDKHDNIIFYNGYDINICFTHIMATYCGKVMSIVDVDSKHGFYSMEEDNGKYCWVDEMFEGLVDYEYIENSDSTMENGCSIDGCQKDNEVGESGDYVINRRKVFESLQIKDNECHISLPEGYQFVDEQNKVIDSHLIRMKRILEYPKTYEECCQVLGIEVRDFDILYNMLDTPEEVYSNNLDSLLHTFRKLLICRDAYWKVAGEKMGLEKPWSPNWSDNLSKYYITFYNYKVDKGIVNYSNKILVFPTDGARNTFYDAFRDDIEKCKEFL